jgi:hypothetical protein
MYCCALSSVEVFYFFPEVIDKSGVDYACFLSEFSDNRVFFAFVGLNVTFYKVPVTSSITQEKIVDLTVFQEYYGAAGFLAKQQPFTKSIFVLLILHRGNLKVICKSTNTQVEHASVVVAALNCLSESGTPKTNSFKFYAQRTYRKRTTVLEFSGV